MYLVSEGLDTFQYETRSIRTLSGRTLWESILPL